MLMPMMYKMGVMMTMLIVLTAISVKGLLVGKWKKEKNLSFRRKKENNDDDAHRKILYAYNKYKLPFFLSYRIGLNADSPLQVPCY